MDGNIVIEGNCELELDKIESNSIDTIITDPPYGLKFKGNKWDTAYHPYLHLKKCLGF